LTALLDFCSAQDYIFRKKNRTTFRYDPLPSQQTLRSGDPAPDALLLRPVRGGKHRARAQ
jgi:hypothetical protein